jgi:crotonobetainyl-CoA:carnitine CoA-transferase CaiB-like acyl-CoA transferase
MMTITGEPGTPPSGFAGGIANQMGAIMSSYGILAGLLARERLGIGQRIDVSHLGSMMALGGLAVAMKLFSGQEIPRENRRKAANPLWNHYKCGDGKWIVLGMLQADRYWPSICKGLGIEHLQKDPRFENMDRRRENCEELISIMDKIFSTESSAEWMKRLKEAGDVVCSSVQTISDLVDDPQAWANEYLVECNHRILGPMKFMGIPVQFSKTPGQIKCDAPEFGQHTEEVLIEVGNYSWEEIAVLKEKEAI